MEPMTDNELKSILIEQYTNLQRIKKAMVQKRMKSWSIKLKQRPQNYQR